MFRNVMFFGLILLFNGCREVTTFLTDGEVRKRAVFTSVKISTIHTTLAWTLSDVTILSDRNDTIYGRIRRPLNDSFKYPVAFLMVGIETGREVVDMIKGFDSVIVFGLDYPYKKELDFTGWKSLTTFMALRQVGFKSVDHIGVSLDWISSLPETDTNNISIISVSFGVFTGVPAAATDSRVDRLVVVQAGGGLGTILTANAQRLQISGTPWIAGIIGGVILAPFEPNKYIGRFSPRPVLLVSGESDQLFPPSSIQSLFDHAREPKEWIRYKSGHVDPSLEKLISELASIVGKKLYRN
jgi:Serine hydrolase (FSH1)